MHVGLHNACLALWHADYSNSAKALSTIGTSRVSSALTALVRILG